MVKMAEPPKREADASDDVETKPKRLKLETEEGVEEPSGSGDVSSLVEELPKEIADALDELDMCQREIDSLNEKASEEILKVEQKYNGLRKPMYSKRTEIISKIPQFWLTAFSNHPQLSSMIEEEEEKCLQYLRDVVVEENEDIKSGYKIRFLFDENPFFENTELMKDIHLPYGSEDVSAAEDRPYIVCTEIKWKAGMNLLKIKEKKPKKRNHYEPSTFLEWLTHDGESIGDEIAEVLKDDIWPNPMQYYLAPDIEENGMDDEDDEEDGLDDEDRKKRHAIAVMVAVDAFERISYVSAEFAGAAHDSRVFNYSPLPGWLQNAPTSPLLLGDKGYACRRYLMTPYRNPTTPEQQAFNDLHTFERNIVERVIGQWKQRMSCLIGPLRVRVEYAPKMILATAVLHNMAKEFNDSLPPPNAHPDSDDDDDNDDNDAPIDDGPGIAGQRRAGEERRRVLSRQIHQSVGVGSRRRRTRRQRPTQRLRN